MGSLTMTSESFREVEKDIIDFSISIQSEKTQTMEEAIRALMSHYENLYKTFSDKFAPYIKIIKYPIRTRSLTKAVEKKVKNNNKTETITTYEHDGYTAYCSIKLEFKLLDIKKNDIPIEFIYNFLRDYNGVMVTINYNILVSDEKEREEYRILRSSLLSDAKEEAKNILANESYNELRIQSVVYNVEVAAVNAYRGCSDMALKSKSCASDECVMTPEAIKLLISESEPQLISDSITTTWEYI